MSNTVTPQEHDVIWLELSAEIGKAETQLDFVNREVINAAGFKKIYSKGYHDFERTVVGVRSSFFTHQALAIAETELGEDADGKVNFYDRETKGDLLAKLAARRAALRATVDAVQAHEADYTGWSRYFLVVSSNGLIHASTSCSSCNKGRSATRFALLPSLSSLGWESAVDALGPSLCSICFPEAPTSVVDGPKLPSRITELLLGRDGVNAFQAELAKYNAKRAAKAAK